MRSFTFGFIFLSIFGICSNGSELDAPLRDIALNLTTEFANRTPNLSDPTVAIFDIEAIDNSITPAAGRGLTALLENQFAQIPYWQIVERSQINRIMEEQKLNQTGAIDSKTAARIGRLGGARISILGSIQKIGSNSTLLLRAVDTETGHLIVSTSKDIPYEKFTPHVSQVAEIQNYPTTVQNSAIINLAGDWQGPYQTNIVRRPINVTFTLSQVGD